MLRVISPFLRRSISTLLEEVESGVFDSIKRFEQVDPNKVAKTSRFADLGLDSLDVVELVVDCEDRFKVELEEEEAIKVENVSELVAALMKHREAN